MCSELFNLVNYVPILIDVQGHLKLGASWEGFALEQLLTLLEMRDTYFWATHLGAELDLLVMIGGQRYGFEFKYSDAPGHTRSMSVAIQDLTLEHLWVVYPGNQDYPLEENISVTPASSLPILAERVRKRAKTYRNQ